MSAAERLDVVDYGVAAKTRWRCQVWSQLKKLRGTKLREDIVLYLPGENDLDARKAMAAGVKPWNLIAVERDKTIARKLRTQGRIVINADLFSVLWNWPDDWRVGVVLADLQCMATDSVIRAGCVCRFAPAFDGVSLLINLQRGRETTTSSEKFRKSQQAHSHLYAAFDQVFARFICGQPKFSDTINRGIWASIQIGGAYLDDVGQLVYVPTNDGDVFDKEKGAKLFDAHWFRPVPLESYRSSRVVMDSIILHRQPTEQTVEVPMVLDNNTSIKRRIAAARAIRTMQLTGQLRQKRRT